jgi:hypothetical protein
MLHQRIVSKGMLYSTKLLALTLISVVYQLNRNALHSYFN